MKEQKSPSVFIVGLALFSMFFGSGNLIFPLALGVQYEGYFYVATIGFVLTAVMLPTLGLLAMIPCQGHYGKLFDGLLQERFSRWFFFIILVFWIPFGSGPRCVLLAYGSLKTFVPMPPIAIFSLVFLAFVYMSLINQKRIIDILGKFLTPILLVSITGMIISSLIRGESLSLPDQSPKTIFLTSLLDGYYTQDLIAAVFFSSAVVGMIEKNSGSMRIALKKTLQGGIIAVCLLATFYAALMASSAVHSESLQGLSGEMLVSALGRITLGDTFGSISSIAVTFACITTEIALVLVFADFLAYHLPHKHSKKASIIITLTIVWLMSLLPFEGIMAIVAPAMKVIYPVLFLLVIRILWIKRANFMKK